MRILLLALALAGTCAAQTAPADDAVGCYRFDHAPWPEGLDHIPSPDGMPTRLELTADPYQVLAPAGPGEVRYVVPFDSSRVVRYPGLPEGAGPFDFWIVEDGRLILNRYLQMAGFVIEATRAGGDWEGTLTGGTDFVPADGHASESVAARLVREPCPLR